MSALVYGGMGVLWAAGVICSPGVTFMLIVSLTVGAFVARRAEPQERRFLLWLYGLAVGVRIALAAILHLWAQGHGQGYALYGQEAFDVFGDSAFYSLRAWWIAQAWLGQVDGVVLDQPTIFGDQGNAIVHLYSAFHYLFGFSQLGVKLINCLLGALTAVISYLLARELCGRAGGRIAAGLVAFFPSTLLWSLGNLKDTPTALALMWMAWGVVLMLQRKTRWMLVPHLAGAIILLWSVRPLLVAPVLVCYGLGLGWHLAWRRWRGRAGVGALLLVAAMAFFLPMRAEVAPVTFWQETLAQRAYQLMGFQRSHALTLGSAYRIYDDHIYQASFTGLSSWPVSVRGVGRALARGLAYFLLAPAPWQITTALQVASLPEMLLWYPLLLMGGWGMWLTWKTHPAVTSTLVLLILVLTLLMALSTGNLGVAFRHRGIVIPLYLVFSAAGLGGTVQWLRRRREATVHLL